MADRSSGSSRSEIGDAESAADIEVADRQRRRVGEAQRQGDRLALRVAEDLGAQVLRPGEDVEAEKLDVGRGQLVEQRRDLFGVDAELLRPAAEAHARALDLEVRIDADGNPRPDAQPLADGGTRLNSVSDSISMVTPAAIA